MKSISAAKASRHFRALLREVAAGQTVTVHSHSQPVVTIAQPRVHAGERAAARRRLLERLLQQASTGARDGTRDDLYDN